MDNFIHESVAFLWNNLQDFSYLATMIGIVVAYLAYRGDKNARREKDRPWIYIDVDSTTIFSICNLVLKNIGGSPAMDIQTVFDPDVEIHSGKTVNNMGIIKKLPFLSPTRDMSFFFGTFMEEKILRPFHVTIKYKDIYGKRYESVQEVNPKAYLGMMRVDGKGVSDIAKSLSNIEKSLKISADSNKDMLSAWKNGLLIRNLHYNDLTLEEKFRLLERIYVEGHKNETWLNPFVYDLKMLFKSTRDSLMAKDKISDIEKKKIQLLNDLFTYLFDLSGNDEFYNKYKQLVEMDKQLQS